MFGSPSIIPPSPSPQMLPRYRSRRTAPRKHVVVQRQLPLLPKLAAATTTARAPRAPLTSRPLQPRQVRGVGVVEVLVMEKGSEESWEGGAV